MKCPRCQAENADERVSCWKCAAPLRSSAMGAGVTPSEVPKVPVAVPPRPIARRRSFPVAVVIVPLVVILGLAGAVGAFMVLNSPERVARAFAEASSKGDIEAMKRLVTAKDREKLEKTKNLPKQPAPTRFVGLERRGDHLVAKLEADLSGQKAQAAAFGLQLPDKMELPFVLVRERLIFWRVDLEKSQPLLKESVMKALGPQLQQFIMAFQQAFGQAIQQMMRQAPQR